MEKNLISVSKFCNLQGLGDDITKSAILMSQKKSEPKSYDEWYEQLSKDYNIGEKMSFVTKKESKSTPEEKK